MKINKILLGGLFSIMAVLPLSAQNEGDACGDECCCSTAHPSSPPFSIMGDHLHHKGGWMVSYRYRTSNMDGLLSGKTDATQMSVFNNYMMSPVDMAMKGHMLGAMYGLNDNITLMAMLPYMKMNMGMTNMMGMSSTMNTSGLGDFKLSAMMRAWSKGNTQLLFNAGISVPTGSIEERGDMGMAEDVLLPYSMQLGSGSWSVLPGLTFTHTVGNLTLGVQAMADIKMNDNSLDYQLGNVYKSNAWLAYRAHDWFSISTGFNAMKSGKLEGRASELNMMMSPMANTINYGNTLISASLGANVYMPWDILKNHAVGLEWNTPIHQEVEGVQLAQKSSLLVGWQYTF